MDYFGIILLFFKSPFPSNRTTLAILLLQKQGIAASFFVKFLLQGTFQFLVAGLH